MGVANPIWLWGLLGLVVPVAIHLLSRKDVRIIRLGTLRHLEHATTRQAVRIHLNAYLLLALRSLIIALLVMLLAGLYMNKKPGTTRWVLVESQLADDETWRSAIDSLVAEGYEARRLQQGFPPIGDATQDLSPPDYWALSEQLLHLPLERCVVISRDLVPGFVGARPAQDMRITWLTARTDSTRFVLLAAASNDSLALRLGRSDATRTSFETLRLPSAQARTVMQSWSREADTSLLTDGLYASDLRPVQVVLSGTAIAHEERRVVIAAIQAIGGNGLLPVQVREVPPDQIGEGDWLIWLSADLPPAHGIKNVIRKSQDMAKPPAMTPDNRQEPLFIHAPDCLLGSEKANRPDKPKMDGAVTGPSNCWIVTQTLSPSTALQNRFTLQLATLLLGDANRHLNTLASRHDRRQLPESEVFAAREAAAIRSSIPIRNERSAGDVLAFALVALFAIERIVANRQQL